MDSLACSCDNIITTSFPARLIDDIGSFLANYRCGTRGIIRTFLMSLSTSASFMFIAWKTQTALVKLQNNVITLSMVTWLVTSYVISTSWWRHGNFLACSFCSLAAYFYLLIIHLWGLNRTVKEFTVGLHWSFRWRPSWIHANLPLSHGAIFRNFYSGVVYTLLKQLKQ